MGHGKKGRCKAGFSSLFGGGHDGRVSLRLIHCLEGEFAGVLRLVHYMLNKSIIDFAQTKRCFPDQISGVVDLRRTSP